MATVTAKKVILKDQAGNTLIPYTDTYSKKEVDTKINGKQNNLNSAQANAVNSGITSALVTKYNGYESKINSKQPTGSYADTNLSNISQSGKNVIKAQIDLTGYMKTVYPVGSFYFSTAGTCPLQSLGIGTWKKVGTSLTLNVNTSGGVKGNGKTLGITDGSLNCGMGKGGSDNRLYANSGMFNKNLGEKVGSGSKPPADIALGIITDPTYSGMVSTITRSQITVNVFQRTA